MNLAHARTGWLIGLLLALQVLPAQAQADDAVSGSTWALFAQAGTSGHTHQLTLGVLVPWTQGWRLGDGRLSGYWDFSLSRWEYPDSSDRRHGLLSQIGVKPTLRWSPGGWLGTTFLEAGVGATLMSDLYRTNGKRFSTRFNFGSHLAVGWPLDAQQLQEVSLRVEHFSNAGIRHPNPGENFLQLRYAHRF